MPQTWPSGSVCAAGRLLATTCSPRTTPGYTSATDAFMSTGHNARASSSCSAAIRARDGESPSPRRRNIMWCCREASVPAGRVG